MVHDYFEKKRANMAIVTTTTTKSGYVIDWVERGSQAPGGKLAEPPPDPVDAPIGTAYSELDLDPGARGPDGTVPVLRGDSDVILNESLPPATIDAYLSKYGEASNLQNQIVPLSAADYQHQYALSTQTVATDNVYGTDGYIYVASPYTYRTDEFSLGQVSLSRGTGSALQTAEAGWHVWRDKYGNTSPHFFVFFTTNNYTTNGNYLGGYNQDVLGWQQNSSTFFPGSLLTAGSELYIRIRNYAGNWWVWANGQWVGYYPGTMYAVSGLRNWANTISWYGEVIDYIYDGTSTYTYMGTGAYAAAGSAYTRNIRWEDTGGTQFNANLAFGASKPGCYTILGTNSSGTTWATYFYWGGPGKYSALCP